MQYDSLSDYLRAAPRHLADATELLQWPSHDKGAVDAGHRHLRGAAYLAGYAVEFALKAYIISRTPNCRTFTQACGHLPERLEGARSHNLGVLLHAAKLNDTIDATPEIAKHWSNCRKWTPVWRYHPKPLTERNRAERIVEAATALWHWLDELRQTSPREEVRQ